jgi:hypothetical protein
VLRQRAQRQRQRQRHCERYKDAVAHSQRPSRPLGRGSAGPRHRDGRPGMPVAPITAHTGAAGKSVAVRGRNQHTPQVRQIASRTEHRWKARLKAAPSISARWPADGLPFNGDGRAGNNRPTNWEGRAGCGPRRCDGSERACGVGYDAIKRHSTACARFEAQPFRARGARRDAPALFSRGVLGHGP